MAKISLEIIFELYDKIEISSGNQYAGSNIWRAKEVEKYGYGEQRLIFFIYTWVSSWSVLFQVKVQIYHFLNDCMSWNIP